MLTQLSTPPALTPEMTALADRFFAAITAGEADVVRSIYAEDVKIWHNFDDAEQDLEQNIQSLSFVVGQWANFRYETVRRRPIEGGFVQQHTIKGEGPGGVPFASPAIVIVAVNGQGKISRIEEYLDPGQLPPIS